MIAFDATTNGGSGTGATLTYSHTTSGANRILIVGVQNANHSAADVVTGVTYGGVSMTRLNQILPPAGTGYNYLYYLINPASGANNVVVSKTGSDTIESFAESYTGVNQSSFPDSSSTNSGNSGTISGTTTVVAANCWLIMTSGNGNGTVTAGTNCTLRQNSGITASAIADSNGTVSTGSISMTETFTGSSGWACIIASIAPAAASNAHFLASTGAGA